MHDETIALCKRMSPEERIEAFYNHSQLMAQVYQLGIAYRKSVEDHPHHKDIRTGSHEAE